MMLRAFIAIALPQPLRQTISQVQQVVSQQSCGWRWVQPDNVHLTLRFLGNISLETVTPVLQVMQRVIAGRGRFSLRVRGLGCFPYLTRPRVLWMGVEDVQHALVPLQTALENALVPLGFAAEARPFSPHLTLARARQRLDHHRLAPLLQTFREHHFGDLTVDQIHLFQSQLHRGGAVYTIVRSVSLQH